MDFRDQVETSDRNTVREIVESTGFFQPHEIDIAEELVDERLDKGIKSGYFFRFAEEDGRTVGYSCFGPVGCTVGSFDLYWIAVHQDRRGRGIGKALLQESEAAIGAMGGRRIYVETSSREIYHPTRAFYLNSGYRIEATLEDFYAPGDSKVIFVKVLA